MQSRSPTASASASATAERTALWMSAILRSSVSRSRSSERNRNTRRPYMCSLRESRTRRPTARLRPRRDKSPKRARTQDSVAEFGAGRSSVSTMTPTAPQLTCGSLYLSRNRTFAATGRTMTIDPSNTGISPSPGTTFLPAWWQRVQSDTHGGGARRHRLRIPRATGKPNHVHCRPDKHWRRRDEQRVIISASHRLPSRDVAILKGSVLSGWNLTIEATQMRQFG
jgi:hypothetical protein